MKTFSRHLLTAFGAVVLFLIASCTKPTDPLARGKASAELDAAFALK